MATDPTKLAPGEAWDATAAASAKAKSSGVNMADVKGTGTGGTVTKADVVAHKTPAPKATAATAKDEKAFHDNKRPLSALPGESGDPDVHFLIAQRDGLQQNRDLLDPPKTPARDAELKGLDAHIADIDRELAKLGYKTSK